MKKQYSMPIAESVFVPDDIITTSVLNTWVDGDDNVGNLPGGAGWPGFYR